MRRIALAVFLVAALVSCDAAPPPSPLARPASGTPSMEKNAVTQTKQVVVEPFTGSELSAGLSSEALTPTEPIRCQNPSRAGTTANTYECLGDTERMLACVQSQLAADAPSTVYCLNRGWETKLKKIVLPSLISTTQPKNPLPLGLEMGDGSRWYLRSGGSDWLLPDGMKAAYLCETGCRGKEAIVSVKEASPFNKTTQIWTVQRITFGPYAKPVTEPVRAVWFVAGAAQFRESSKIITVDKVVKDAASIETLTMVGPGFRNFLARELRTSAIRDCAASIKVLKYREDGFAVGELSQDCATSTPTAPSTLYWSKASGSWVRAEATSGLPGCEAMNSNQMPSDIAGNRCLDGQATVEYSRP